MESFLIVSQNAQLLHYAALLLTLLPNHHHQARAIRKIYKINV